MTNLTKRLGEIKERLEKATPGPWTRSANRIQGGGLPDGVAHIMDADAGPVREANAHLIAAAPQDLALLLKVVEAQAEALEKVLSETSARDHKFALNRCWHVVAKAQARVAEICGEGEK